MKLEIRDLCKEFRHSKRGSLLALDRVGMEVASREFVSIVGASGCGKTTLLEIIAGLQEKTSGEILIDGLSIEKSPSNRAIVFQHYALSPWLTVQKNIEYGPKIRKIDRKERTRVCRTYIDIVGLNAEAVRVYSKYNKLKDDSYNKPFVLAKYDNPPVIYTYGLGKTYKMMKDYKLLKNEIDTSTLVDGRFARSLTAPY